MYGALLVKVVRHFYSNKVFIVRKFSNVMTKVYKKKNGRLTFIEENAVYNKSQLRLINEDGVTASIGQQNGMSQMLRNAQKAINSNPGVTAATTDLGKVDGVNDAESGEGIVVEVPYNANAQTISNINKMASNQSMDDAEIKVVKPNQGMSSTNESRYRNAIPFTKMELNELFEEIIH